MTEEEKEFSEKRKNPLVIIFKTEWEHMGKQKKKFFLYLGLFFIAGIISLFTPYVIGTIFNSIQQNISSTAELKKLIFMIFLLFAINIGFWLFHGSGRILEELTGFFIHRNFTNSKIKKVLELPVKWHKDNHSGSTIDKINRARSSVDSVSTGMIYEIVYAITNMFGSLIILFFIDAKIAIFAFTYSLIILLVIMRMDKKLIIYYRKLNKYSNKLGASLFDYLSNIITVITLRLKKSVAEEIDVRVMDSYETTKKSVILNEFKWGFASVAITLMTVLALSFKAYSDFNSGGIILIGTLYMLYGYLRNVGDVFYKFASLYGELTRHSARIQNADPIDEEYEKIKSKTGGKMLPSWKGVELRNVNFKYNSEGNVRHMDNVTLKFKRGQKIALVGESGSGKSTILSLMRGLYELDKGEVYIDGNKVSNGISKLKQQVTLIPQEPEIFNNTIEYNITMDLPASKEEINKVIKMAQFEKVVERLEKRLKTNVLEKGVSLSGGEKQRLALARGLLAAKKSDILLLDEPTSSVDTINEMKIHDNIFKEYKNKTIISSIHRLNLLDKFDYIYMFEKGKIIAHGTFNDMQKNPQFRKILLKYKLKR